MQAAGIVRLGLAASLALPCAAPVRAQAPEAARIYIEYNESGNDLGFHVLLEAEDWTDLKIFSPAGQKIVDVQARAGYKDLGLTELFFEGAEPALDEVPLEDLLARFPEGEYTFIAKTVENERVVGTATLTHDVPAGPIVSTGPAPSGDTITIAWTPVTGPAAILPEGDVDVAAYQVIAGSFQVTLPAFITSVSLPAEYYQSLAPGTYGFEVLAIDAGGNQTIAEGTFEKP